MTADASALPPPRLSASRLTLLVVPLLVVAAWAHILLVDRALVGDLVAAETWSRARAFVGSMLGQSTELSPGGAETRFLDGGRWLELGALAYETLAMSVLAIGFAVAGMLATVMVGARSGKAHGGLIRRGLRAGAYLTVRGVWVVSRAVPELVWALVIVFVMHPGVLAGALALAIHNFGIVGRLCAEVVEDIDPRPQQALRASGAGRAQVLAYAVLPQALPKFLTYSLYRWEVIIRTTIIVGFVSAGGLGHEFRLAMSFFHYTDIAMILATYLALVLAADWVTSFLRRVAAN